MSQPSNDIMRKVPFALSTDTISDPNRLELMGRAMESILEGNQQRGWILMGLSPVLLATRRVDVCSFLTFGLHEELDDDVLANLVMLWSRVFYTRGYDFFLPEDTFDKQGFAEEIADGAKALRLNILSAAVASGISVDDVLASES